MRQVPIVNPEVRNPGMIYDTDPGVAMGAVHRAHIIQFWRCVKPRAIGINIHGWQGSGVQFDFCWDALAELGEMSNPFRPSLGGHGHAVRHINSVGGRTRWLKTNGARHTSNYVHSIRSGSFECTANDNVTPAFQTHGWESIDCYSEGDTVTCGDKSGWSLGNPEYGSDDGFVVTRPRYFGTGRAFLARSKSKRLRVNGGPIVRAGSGDVLLVSQGADDVVLDVRGGDVQSDGHFVRAAADVGEGSAAVGAIKVIGDEFRGSGQFSVNIAGDLALDGVPQRLSSGALFSGKGAVMPQLGHSVTRIAGFPAGLSGNAATWETANGIAFARVDVGGRISKVGMHVDVSSGNISVAVFRGSGAGSEHVPTTRVATSGEVACPASGYQEVLLGATVDVEPGDFLALSCDNTTASFRSLSGFTSPLFAGSYYKRGTAHPAPATAGSVAAGATRMPMLVGI